MTPNQNTAQVIKRLTVTRCDVRRTGVGRDRRPYTIYTVEALDEAGLPVDADLRAFTELPLDVEAEYEVLRYDPERGEPSFTLKPRR